MCIGEIAAVQRTELYVRHDNNGAMIKPTTYLNRYVTANVGMMIRSAFFFRLFKTAGSMISVASLTSILPTSSSIVVPSALRSRLCFSIVDEKD